MSNNPEFSHLPVMSEQVMEMLAPGNGSARIYIDATCGLGGHLEQIARRLEKENPQAFIIAIDQDEAALARAKKRLEARGFDFKAPRIELVHGNFADIEKICKGFAIDSVDGGILADIGVSSMQLDDPERGFSFRADGPLDMRMDRSRGASAAELLNQLSEKDIADILFKYGEERASRAIARKIVAARPIESTQQLTKIVSSVLGKPHKYGPRADKSDPATRTFQALRIAVNGELEALEKFLLSSIRILEGGARLVVISFHSLEDRLIKQIFKSWESDCVCPPKHPICNCSKVREFRIITKKPLQPNEQETLANPRSRSAKLRAGERLEEGR